MRFPTALLVLLFAGCAGGSAPPPRLSQPSLPPGPQAKPHAPFVLAIVVDQLSAWVAASRWPELPKTGGFARLIREGTWVKKMRYPYATTDTAPGHTSLHTGKVPAESGIFGNELPDENGRRYSVVRDATTRVVASDGPRASMSSSPARLRAPTVADRLRAAHPNAFVVSVSIKDRAAILPGGKQPTHALWFDPSQDSFVTSTAYTDKYPKWAIGVGDARAVAAARSIPWELTDPAWVKAHSAGPDAQPGEGDLEGLGITFPHVARTPVAFRATPAGDEMIIKLGLAAMEAEYDPGKPTLLLLSMSASDIAGHVFGPDSWEAWDQLLKLDAKLAFLLDTLERRLGPVPVILAADHGNLSMPEIPPERVGVRCPPPPADPFGRPCTMGGRIDSDALRDRLIAAAKGALGEGGWVVGMAAPYVYLSSAARALPDARRALLDEAVRATFAKNPDVQEIIDARTLGARCPETLARAPGVPERARVTEETLAYVCRSWAPGLGAGDYYVVPKIGSVFDGEIVPLKGASHGSPHLYDRTVSMLVRAPGQIDAGAVIEDPVDFSVYAALEAALVGLDTRAPRDILAAHVATGHR